MSVIRPIVNYPVTKKLQSDLAAEIMQPLINGEIDPIEFIVKIKGLINAFSEVDKNKDVKDLVIREIEKNGKFSSWNEATVTVKETGVKFDYTSCNDPVYCQLLSEKALIDQKIKEREAFLKNIPDGTTIVDEATGEVYRVIKPVRMATESFSISFKKQ